MPTQPFAPPRVTDLHQKYRRVYAALLALSIPLILLLPAPASLVVLLALLITSGALLLDDRHALKLLLTVDLPQIARPARLYVVEIALVLIALGSVTQHFQNWAYDQRLGGNEFSYLINSGVTAANVYHETGRLPLWNPFMGRGEPLLENPFSFVLNPLMTLPIFWLGTIQGTKVAVLLHIALLGLGGWALGWVLGLKTPGRLLLALLLGGAGSVAGALAMGFYQMGLSQTYVPWVYAGLLGTIYRPQARWSVALLALAGTLLIFAGTFWYVLPTALSCALLVAFHAVRRHPETHRLYVDTPMLRRVAFAAALLIGLAAVRLLPQAVHHAYIDHPLEYFDGQSASFFDVLRTYITPAVVPPFSVPAMHYHYIIPFSLVAFLVIGRLLIAASGNRIPARWRVVIPALLLIAGFSAWGQDGGAFVRWLYVALPVLREWRFVGRMLAAAAPWIAVVAALWLDQIVGVLWRSATQPDAPLLKRWRAALRLSTSVSSLLLLAALVLGALSANQVLGNWRNWGGTETNGFLERAPLAYLRHQNPNAFLAVLSSSFFGYLPFYENAIRASYGNPDYHPLPVEPTLGNSDAMNFPPTYALGLSSLEYHDMLRSVGFRAVPGNNGLFAANVLWENPGAPTYLFAVDAAELEARREPLTRAVTLPVNTFVHHIDTIDATLSDYDPGLVLVAQEVAYPGWQVSIDGTPAQIESVGGLIGVRLLAKAAGAPPTQVIFAYRPMWLFIGAAITLVSGGMLMGYVLRLDRRLKRLRALPG